MEPVSEKKWKDPKLLYVNYQYHKDVCAKSLERADEIEDLEKKLEYMQRAFLHSFVPDEKTTDSRFCKECGLYITDEVHERLTPPKPKDS